MVDFVEEHELARAESAADDGFEVRQVGTAELLHGGGDAAPWVRPVELAKPYEHVVKGSGCGDTDPLTFEAHRGGLGFRHFYEPSSQ
jgi:hypothetical protein